MNKIIFSRLAKNKSLELTFFVLFSLVISVDVFSIMHWKKDYVQVNWSEPNKRIGMRVLVYIYSGPKSASGYLDECRFEASVDGVNYFGLMYIYTKQQKKSNSTILYFLFRLEHVQIHFFNNMLVPFGAVWPEQLKDCIKVEVPNCKDLAIVDFGWSLDHNYSEVRNIRISGSWQREGIRGYETFNNVVYKLNIPGQPI